MMVTCNSGIPSCASESAIFALCSNCIIWNDDIHFRMFCYSHKKIFKSIELLRCWHSLTHALTREGGKSDSAHKNKGLMMVYQSQAWKLILCPSFAFALTSFIQTDNNPPEYITVIISNQQSLSEHCDSLRFRFNSILIKM